jgi:hypothetical protein
MVGISKSVIPSNYFIQNPAILWAVMEMDSFRANCSIFSPVDAMALVSEGWRWGISDAPPFFFCRAADEENRGRPLINSISLRNSKSQGKASLEKFRIANLRCTAMCPGM